MTSTWCWCKTCARNFVDWNALQQHWESNYAHIEDHQFCNVCQVWCPDEKGLASHLKNPRYHNICFTCEMDFGADRTACDLHMREHGKCPFQGCGKVFQPDQLNEHLQYAHLHCQKYFPSPDELVRHYRLLKTWALGVQHFYCSKCFLDFEDNTSLENHYFDSPAHFYCLVCKLHMFSKKELHNHFTRWVIEPHYYCGKCFTPFRTEQEYVLHTTSNPGTHSYCHQCREIFPQKAALVAHKRLSPAHNYCETCDKDFEDEDFLSLHLQKQHNHCKMCNQSFDTLDELENHKRLGPIHQYCIECEKDFVDADILTLHRRAKHDYCGICDKVFSSPMELNEHVSTLHHYCERCNRCYESLDAFEEHMAQSSNHKHRCLKCDFESADLEDVVNHDHDQHPCCDLCHIEFGEKLGFEAHISDYHLKEVKEINEVTCEDTRTEEPSPIGIGKTCIACQESFSSKLALVAHCEEGDCWTGFYDVLSREDGSRSFTTDSITKATAKEASVETPKGSHDWSGYSLSFAEREALAALAAHHDSPDHRLMRFKCPHPFCGDLFSTFGELLSHLNAMECGIWVEECGNAGLDHLRAYLS
ncbi:uncharacterized protein F4822DRAFT_443344 [Hypoxylon trugodes]|uniref:uncharacterized protein n=1 Tax=Hypoxylon trugodes TaxID=326681 RepID=UPI00218CB708|nr:uncharacterized protein F4822DRAFT_443344 [Hypoxylon trugodes]KAI1388203.1 hypothetical protein F4822DRAFT_443344 [Hypoxylon trugodes]